jgi:lipopolysaccharide transport system permease protein
MKEFNSSPVELYLSISRNKGLLLSLIKRDILGRYRGSMMGLLWSFLTPLFMLSIYTLVFGQIFKTRWPGAQTDSQGEFALTLFAGLIVFNFFAECVTKAPTIIWSNVNYVKKVVFPLELLPCVNVGVSVFHMLISLFVWVIVYCLFFGLPKATVIITPLVIIPLIMLTCGMVFILSSVGTYLRDIVQLVGVAVTAMMFLSPIFFPIAALPAIYQKFALINPLTFPIEQLRVLMISGLGVNWSMLLIYNLVALSVLIAGFAFFQKTRRGFADVL